MLLEKIQIHCCLDVANMMHKPPANADPHTEDEPPPPPANWPTTVERLVERWGWVHTIALLAVVLVFSLVWRLSHGQINLWQYRQQRYDKLDF